MSVSSSSRRDLIRLAAAAAASAALPSLARAVQRPESYTSGEIVENGHHFFGSISRGLAEGLERANKQWGKPNAYILGQEAGGAFVGGVRYGEGTMFTRNAGQKRVYWQGPSIGFDAGADGDRTMMLVYNLPDVEAIYRRYAGVNGSAYLVGGLGFTALNNEDVVVMPVRSGVGARLGVALGYLKFTPDSTWNPF
ncbi:DUF1134 domain-containing protein [Methylocystis sp. MJC1]|jgi:hypothetical protein|uniref:DUF1134 domain-containing protein n=1 Tax=Methylocystis sp. MJC1 TaxID=2654282 RepID=UPI0013EC9D06|nr:DUF1134 domain-containing protein [Methylocystis sp. MJC1]KAF2990338.1 hypothetical protein MJC1_02437 [Methylocystis sp. MJC1]MBU6528138.1 DUF1134 domain-containing protein [Methylocystis sp. MJC1]UZX11050.1 DUF1134 domain-containing protein [Methylocystis sp. MJC1]